MTATRAGAPAGAQLARQVPHPHEVDPGVLAPVRAALLAAARQEADRGEAQARARAAETLTAAAGRADAIVSAARAAGAADAEAVARIDLGRARRAARARTLRARREAYDRLRRESRQAVGRVRDEPGYAAIRATLTAAAQRLLGPDAEVVDAEGGGVIARTGSRRVDLSLRALADRAVDRVAAGLEQP